MRRLLIVFGGLMLIVIVGASLLWFWLTPHKNALVRRAEKGDVQAMYDVGISHLSISGKGIIDPKSRRDPVYWFRLAAANGHSGAMYVLADLGIPNEEKVMWLKKGAELGSKACTIELRNGYEHGMYGLPQDPVQAKEWQGKVRSLSEEELRQQGYIVPRSK